MLTWLVLATCCTHVSQLGESTWGASVSSWPQVVAEVATTHNLPHKPALKQCNMQQAISVYFHSAGIPTSHFSAKLVKVESWKIEFKLSRSSQFHLRFNYKMKSWQSWEGIKVLTTLLLIHLLSFCRAMQVNRELRTVSNLILLPTFGSLRKNLKYGKWIWR